MNKKRECQPCTACCDGWVQMVINGVAVYPGKPCPHSTDKGCDNYANRPVDPCSNFKCGWIVENSPLPDWMRPDEGKVIVIFNKLQWNGYPVDVAVPVGEKIPPKSLDWFKKFSEEYMRPLIYMEQVIKSGELQKQQETIGYGPPEFLRDLVQWKEEGINLW